MGIQVRQGEVRKLNAQLVETTAMGVSFSPHQLFQQNVMIEFSCILIPLLSFYEMNDRASS